MLVGPLTEESSGKLLPLACGGTSGGGETLDALVSKARAGFYGRLAFVERLDAVAHKLKRGVRGYREHLVIVVRDWHPHGEATALD